MNNTDGSVTGKTTYVHDDSGSSADLEMNIYCPICQGILNFEYISYTFERVGHAEWCSRFGTHPAEAE